MELNNRLLNLQLYNCARCGDVLNWPVMERDTYKYICGRCFKLVEDKGRYKRNESVERILMKLILPCRYRKNGCMLQLPFEEIRRHELSCEFKMWNCLSHGNCSWSGLTNEILRHFECNHPELLIKSENFLFTYCVDLKNRVVENKLLLCDNELFLLVIDNRTTDVSVRIKYLVGVNENLSYYIDYTVRTDKVVIRRYDEDDNNETIIDLTAFDTNCLALYIKIYSNCVNELKLNKNVLDELKCSVCKSIMYTDIIQCCSGHNICEDCHSVQKTCSVCNSSFNDCHNYVLINLRSVLYLPCKYENVGCGINLSYDSILEHNMKCSFKPRNCPVTNCPWSNRPVHMMKHLQDKHQITEKNEFAFSIREICNGNGITKVTSAYNNAFYIEIFLLRISNEIDHIICKCVQYTGFYRDNYLYEIILNNANGSLIKPARCTNLNEIYPDIKLRFDEYRDYNHIIIRILNNKNFV